MSVARVMGATVDGVAARPVEVQCALADGLPSFAIIGLADKAVSEARERVRAALGAIGVPLPPRRISVSLVPADLPKAGAGLDLPIALALLSALDLLPRAALDDALVVGELALDGALLPPKGLLLVAIAALAAQKRLVLPASGLAQLTPLDGLEAVAAANLAGLLTSLREGRPIRIGAAGPPPGGGAASSSARAPDHARHLPTASAKAGATPAAPTGPRAAAAGAHAGHAGERSAASPAAEPPDPAPDLADVKGQERGRRALEIAAAGRHHILMIGPPGAGKSMLAERLPGLLPPLERDAHLEVLAIHAAAGHVGEVLSRRPPFRHPHHTASVAAIIGGGTGAGPGEISLAHHGVLFLDELPEFSRPVLEGLREPLETGHVTIARANALNVFPARFLLVAAANPCRCGHAHGGGPGCGQAPRCSERYLGRLSGPLLDRFDLRLSLAPVPLRELASIPHGETTATVAARVAEARRRQDARWRDLAPVTTNADARGRVAESRLAPAADARDMLLEAAERLGFSARGFGRILRVARTIADLEESEKITAAHMAEAISYRLPATARPAPLPC